MEIEKNKIIEISEDKCEKYLLANGYKQITHAIGSCFFTAYNGLNSITVYSRIFYKEMIWEPKQKDLDLFIKHSPNTEIVRLDIRLFDDYSIEDIKNVITHSQNL